MMILKKIPGEYYVLLPDGRVQTVRYSVDPYSGFQARVVYDKVKKIICKKMLYKKNN